MQNFQMSHLLSERQGQNPADVGVFCLGLCSEDRCICRPFGFLNVCPHSGHSFSLLLSSLLLSLLGSVLLLELWWLMLLESLSLFVFVVGLGARQSAT